MKTINMMMQVPEEADAEGIAEDLRLETYEVLESHGVFMESEVGCVAVER